MQPKPPKKPKARKHQGVRKVVRRGHGSFVGYFPSSKSQEIVPYESTLEQDFLHRAEVDAEITAIRAQPTWLKWDDDGTSRSHAPDFEIIRSGQKEYVEVKFLQMANTEAVQRRTASLSRSLVATSCGYSLLSEDTIRTEPQLGNAKVLLNGHGQMPAASIRKEVLNFIQKAEEPTPIRDIVSALGKPPSFVNAIYALIITGDLEIADPLKAFNRHSTVRLRHHQQEIAA